MKIKSNTIFANIYNKIFRMILKHDKERYTFTGGRASCKSSFISLCIVILIVMFPSYNALIIRKTAKNLRRSVFEQIVWAINILGLRARFKIPQSETAALPITYTRKDGRKQQIIFAGCDNPEKLKSLKVAQGYFAILWESCFSSISNCGTAPSRYASISFSSPATIVSAMFSAILSFENKSVMTTSALAMF